MTFSIEDGRNSPGAEFAHFTNRVDELTASRRVLKLLKSWLDAEQFRLLSGMA